MITCRCCMHYTPSTAGLLGSCSRWRQGYGWSHDEIRNDEVVIENDEGWGANMGPDFGCILGEMKYDLTV